MEFQRTKIPDVLRIHPKVHGDARGFFMETFQQQRFVEAGISQPFVQDNHSGSAQNILRGLHYQIRLPQGKLVRVIAGEVYDVAVDLRRSSPTFRKWVGETLSAENKIQLWVPPGFAHGFYVVSEWAEVVYKVTDYWAPENERTLLWNDPEVGVRWPLVADEPKLSAKDREGALLKRADLFD